MTDFKIDKLGWYKSRCGTYHKVIHFLESFVISICKENKFSLEHKFNGESVSNNDDIDLIEYIGPELLKEPRKIEFEGLFRMSAKYLWKEEERTELFFKTNKCIQLPNENTKWHVTMEEIIE